MSICITFYSDKYNGFCFYENFAFRFTLLLHTYTNQHMFKIFYDLSILFFFYVLYNLLCFPMIFQANADFKELKLCEVDIHRWNNIRIMYSDVVLHKCLDIFSNNTKLVFWLREATDSMLINIIHIV